MSRPSRLPSTHSFCGPRLVVVPRMRILLACAVVLVAILLIAPLAVALPQLPSNLPIPPVTGQNPPPPSGNNNNNNNRPSTTTTPPPSRTATTTTASSASTATATPSQDDNCESGRCKVPARDNAECISLERTQTCKQFVGLYVPIDLRAYFDQAYPKKKPDAIPAPLESGQQFNTLYASANYSYPTRYMQSFMINQVGCSVPNQLFHKTSFCWELFQYYRDVAKHPCSALGPAPKICQSTLDARADSIQRDLNNGTACPVGQSARDQGTRFANDLKRHPYANDQSGCIDGLANEMDFATGMCGYSDPLTACDFGCKGVAATECAKLRQERAALGNNAPQAPLCDENDREPCAKGLPIGYIVLIVMAVGVVIGLATLFWTRRKVDRAELMKEEPMTLARPTGTQAAAANEPLLATTTAAADVTPAVAPPQASPASLSPPQPAALTAGGLAAATTTAGAAATAAAAASGAGSPPSPSMAGIAPIPPQCTGVDATEATVAKVRGGFPGTQDGELPLLAGDLVTVHNRFADGWALGTRHPTHGRPALTGYFPAAYLVEADVAQVPRRADSLRRPVR